MDWVRTALTGRDNASTDVARVLLAACVLALIALETVAVLRGQPFEPHMFAIACGALLFGGCAGVAVKANTEPGDHHDR